MLTLSVGLVACDDDSSQSKENWAKQENYDHLVAEQPAGRMDYSPAREAISQWMKTWGEPGRLPCVYIQNGKGEYGYFIVKGLPVPRCKKLTPTEEVDSDERGKAVVQQSGMDGVYSSGSTCNAYCGFDATTCVYMEFTGGTEQPFFLFGKPMRLPEFSSAE